MKKEIVREIDYCLRKAAEALRAQRIEDKIKSERDYNAPVSQQ